MTLTGNLAIAATDSASARSSSFRPARKMACTSSSPCTSSRKICGMLPPPTQPALTKTVNFSGSSPSARRAASEKDGLHVQLAVHQLSENLRDVAAANPARVDEDGELFRVESERAPSGLRRALGGQLELRVDGHARNFYAPRRDAVINQLLLGLLAGDEVERHVVARPALPEAVAGVCDHGDERDFSGESEFPDDAREGVLRERVDTDDDFGAPALEEFAEVL